MVRSFALLNRYWIFFVLTNGTHFLKLKSKICFGGQQDLMQIDSWHWTSNEGWHVTATVPMNLFEVEFTPTLRQKDSKCSGRSVCSLKVNRCLSNLKLLRRSRNVALVSLSLIKYFNISFSEHFGKMLFWVNVQLMGELECWNGFSRLLRVINRSSIWKRKA